MRACPRACPGFRSWFPPIAFSIASLVPATVGTTKPEGRTARTSIIAQRHAQTGQSPQIQGGMERNQIKAQRQAAAVADGLNNSRVCGLIRRDIQPGENSMTTFERITRNPAVMGGKPCIRGTRVTVGLIVGMLAGGHDIPTLLADYPYLCREDVLEALRYAAWLSEERELELAG